MRIRPFFIILAPALLCMAFLLSGCELVGFIASAAAGTEMVAPAYKGLAGQKCAVMVWADEGVVNDYTSIQLDAAHGIQVKLQEAARAKIDDVADITWVSPEQILQYQQNHPESRSDAVEDVAARLGVSRLIYVEIEQFQTHPNESPDLARGSMSATVEVVEVANGHGKVAYTERNVGVISPRNCPPEGLPNLADGAVYQGTIEAFTSAVDERFVPHEVDTDEGDSTADTSNVRFQQ
jgi:hypothetical protein